jgi:hypothetical protein
VDKGIQSKVSFEPIGIRVFGFLIDGERYCPDQSNAEHGCRDPSKETSISLRSKRMPDTIREVVIFVSLHSSLDRVQRKLGNVSGLSIDQSKGNLTAAKVDMTLLIDAATSVRYRLTHLFCGPIRPGGLLEN